MSSILKTFHWHTMFECIVSVFLGFFNSKVSGIVFEKKLHWIAFSGPFQRYIILFCNSNIRWFLELYIPLEIEKSSRLSGFYLVLTLWSFSEKFLSKTMIDMKLKLLGYTIYDKIYRLVSNRRMSTFTMVRWHVLSLNMWRYAIMYKDQLNGS